MPWSGSGSPRTDAARTVRPVAYSGFEKGYSRDAEADLGRHGARPGPTGTAIRTGKPCSCRNMFTDPAFAPWREEALKRGYASSLVLPLMAGGKAFGAITIYERKPDAFSEDETDLLSDLADDLAFGITSLRMREAHARMEDELRSLALFPDENPGPVMRVSKDGTILYGNKAAAPILACWESGVRRRRCPNRCIGSSGKSWTPAWRRRPSSNAASACFPWSSRRSSTAATSPFTASTSPTASGSKTRSCARATNWRCASGAHARAPRVHPPPAREPAHHPADRRHDAGHRLHLRLRAAAHHLCEPPRGRFHGPHDRAAQPAGLQLPGGKDPRGRPEPRPRGPRAVCHGG